MAPHNHHILVVEDDLAYRWALAMHFQKLGAEVDIAENVVEATDLLQKRWQRYCAVVLDLKLVKADGTDLLEILRDKVPMPGVIVVTGYPEATTRIADRGMSDLVRFILHKPVPVETVAAKVQEICRG